MIMNVAKELIGGLFLHAIIVSFLGLIGFFVWNSGVVGLVHNLPTISYQTSTAIMLGVYIINMFVKIQVNRVLAVRQQKYMIDKIVDFYTKNAKG
jgi:hypothetical protein